MSPLGKPVPGPWAAPSPAQASGNRVAGQAQGLDAASFAAMHAERVGVAAPVAEAVAPSALPAASGDRPFTLGDAILRNMGQLSDAAQRRWTQVAAPISPEAGFNSADLLNRQMHLQLFMAEVEFASLLGKQAAKTVDQISHTQ